MTDQELIWICFEPVVFPYPKILYGSSDPNGDKDIFVPYVPADRIEELVKERDAALANQTYTYIGKDMKPILARDLEDAKDIAEAKLAKAVEALQKIAAHPYSWRTLAHKVLAELEKE